MNKVKFVYLIDPFEKRVDLVDLYKEGLELPTIYKLLQCATMDVYSLTKDTDVYIDDEGLFVEDQKFFVIEDKVFAGRALIVGAPTRSRTPSRSCHAGRRLTCCSPDSAG